MVPKNRTYNNSEILTGICEDCCQILPIEKFDISAKQDNKIYYRSKCHECFLFYRKKYRKENNHQNTIYKLNNKEIIAEYNKNYYSENKSHLQDLNSENYKKYKKEGRALEYSRNFRANNREKSNSYTREFYKKKRLDIGFRLGSDISRSIRALLKNNNGSKNKKNSKHYLPFTIDELKTHLEILFEPWMTWGNRGKYNIKKWDDNNQSTWTWNIDHIIPQSKLPYSSMEDDNFKLCWELSNLRPYSAKQNIIDGNRR